MQQNAKKLLKIISLSIFFLFIILYAFFRSKELIFGIKIKDVNMQNARLNDVVGQGIKVNDSSFLLTGNAKNATNLYLNGREISVDQKGNFKEDLALLSGYNIINIKAKDKFGNVDEKNYQVINIGH